MKYVSDKLDLHALCSGGQEELPVLCARRETDLFVEASERMPETARRETEVAAGAKIIRRRQRPFTGSQLVCRILDFSPIQFRLHVDAMSPIKRVRGEVAGRDSLNKSFAEENVRIGHDHAVAIRPAKCRILCGHLMKWHLWVKDLFMLNIRWAN